MQDEPQDVVTRWDGQWRPLGGWRTIPIAGVALTFVLGGCSLGGGSGASTASSVVVPTAQATTVAGRASQGSAAPASVYTSRSGPAQRAEVKQIERGACALLPAFDELHQGTVRYQDVETAIEMQLYGSAPADNKDAMRYFRQAQSTLSHVDPPAGLTHVRVELQTAAASFLTAAQALQPELAKNNVKVMPTHRGAYERGKTLVGEANAELQSAELKAGVSTTTPCPGYTPPSQNVFDNSELDFSTGLSSKTVNPEPASPTPVPTLVAAVPTPVTRVIYVTRSVVVPARPVRASSHTVAHRHAAHVAPTSQPTQSEPAPARPTPRPPLPTSTPVVRPAPAPVLASYLQRQDQGLARVLDASDALNSAIRDLQANLVSDAEIQLTAARKALSGEKTRLSKVKPPTADLGLVRYRENRAIKAYVNAYAYAVRALTSEHMTEVTIPRMYGDSPVIEYESPQPRYLKGAQNAMQRAGVHWQKARKLFRSIHR